MPSPRPWRTITYFHSIELTNPPGHLWRDKWTALSGPLACCDGLGEALVGQRLQRVPVFLVRISHLELGHSKL